MNTLSPRRLPNVLAIVGLSFWASSIAWAGPPVAAPRTAVLDAEVGPNGGWAGTVVTAEGIPVSGTRLELTSGSGRRPPLSTVTDDNGCFRLENVHAGPYSLRWRRNPVCRLCSMALHPPPARSR